MKNAQWKMPGTREIIHFETNSGVVIHSDTTVASVLKSALTTENVSEFMQGIMAAENRKNILRALKLYPDPFFDEKLWRWINYNYTQVSSENAKFNNAVQLTGKTGVWRQNFEFGGEDLTIEFFGLLNANCISYGTLFSAAVSSENLNSSIHIKRYAETNTLALLVTDAEGNTELEDLNVQIPINPIGFIRHYALVYNHAYSTLKFFVDGQLLYSKSDVEIEKLPRTVALGNVALGNATFLASGTVSEFRISTGICRYNENFSPPTEKFSLDEFTFSLLHFD